MTIEEQIAKLISDNESFQAKRLEEIKALGTVSTETQASLTRVEGEIKAAIARMDAMEVNSKRVSAENGPPSLLEELKSNADLGAFLKRGRGSIKFDLSPKSCAQIMEQKNISNLGLGYGTPGVIAAERDAGITWVVRPTLRMRSVLSSRPCGSSEVYWVTESVRPTKASPVTEYTGLKPLSEPTFSVGKEPIQTIAILCLASNQVLSDFSELEGFIRTELAARVQEEEDRQILFGDATPPALNSLTHQATAWDLTTLTASSGYTFLDILAGARKQVAVANEVATQPYFVVNPSDLWHIRMAKDSYGRYLLGDPMSPFAPALWGAPILDSTQMTSGYFLHGSADPRVAEIRDRKALTIELSTEDSTNFRYNLVTCRAELRLALVVKRPAANIYGAFTQSPA